MRPIDGDALRDKLQNLADDDWNQSTTTTWAEAFYACADIVAEAPTIEPEPHWIPCSERLPAYGEDVLITTDGYCNIGHILRVYGEEQYCWFFSGWYHEPNEVVAWIPLPKPYKEGENDDHE